MNIHKLFEMFLESVSEGNGSVPISDLNWNSNLADVILNALKELHHDVSNINSHLNTGIVPR